MRMEVRFVDENVLQLISKIKEELMASVKEEIGSLTTEMNERFDQVDDLVGTIIDQIETESSVQIDASYLSNDEIG